MTDSGLFKGVEDKASACTNSIQAALEAYETSQAGHSAHCQFSGDYYKYIGTLFGEMRSAPTAEVPVYLEHLTRRVRLNTTILSIALARIYRRALYCRSFNEIHLNQMKLAGLHAYWLNKLHPIAVSAAEEEMGKVSREFEVQLNEINERFGFHLILSAYQAEYGMPKDSCGIPIEITAYQERFVHALRFRSFTEDSIMLLTESLGREGFQLACIQCLLGQAETKRDKMAVSV